MTCHELHVLIEDSVRPLDSEADYGIAEHIAACSECRNWTEAQMELRVGLQAIRNSAPDFPPLLDSKVVASYRRNTVATGSIRNARLTWKFNPLPALAWCAALVAAIVLARTGIEWLLPSEDRAGWIQQQHTYSPAPSKLPATAPAPRRTLNTSAQSEILPARTAARRTQASHEAIGRTTTPAVIDEQLGSLPSGFTGLMYCDLLSCDGAMEVVRVQLPPQQLGLTHLYAGSNNLVSADLLVGADGVARGVRIVE